MVRNVTALFAGLVLVGCATHPEPLELSLPVYEKSAVEDDLNTLVQTIKATHPDLAYSADLDALESKREEILRALPSEMEARDAWMAMAQLNPLFADAHVGLRAPLALMETSADAELAPMLMSAPVRITSQNEIVVASASAMLPGVDAGSTITAINGIDAETIVETLLPRMRGETEELRRLILGLRFDAFFWTAFGGYEGYDLTIRDGNGTTVHSFMPSTDQAADAPYAVRQLTPQIAYLDVPSFDRGREDEFAAFLPGAFEEIHNAGATTLVIDLRENTGGAQQLSDRLMAYLTDQPYASTSKVKARVVEANQRLLPGLPLGMVVDVPFAQAVTPPAELPYRFDGDVVLLVGPLTYSQAIVFSATAIDAGIVRTAGQPTEGPANQTGQVQSSALPNTGFDALAPIYIFTRRSGEEGRAPIEPSIKLNAQGDDGLQELVSILRKEASPLR